MSPCCCPIDSSYPVIDLGTHAVVGRYDACGIGVPPEQRLEIFQVVIGCDDAAIIDQAADIDRLFPGGNHAQVFELRPMDGTEVIRRDAGPADRAVGEMSCSLIVMPREGLVNVGLEGGYGHVAWLWLADKVPAAGEGRGLLAEAEETNENENKGGKVRAHHSLRSGGWLMIF